MKFDQPAGANPIDRMTVVGQPHPRIDGPLKTTGTAPYAAEHRALFPNVAFGVILGAPIARGHVRGMDLAAAKRSPGVRAIVTAADAGPLGKGDFNTVPLLGGPQIAHYHQALAVVVADTFEQARAAAALIRVDAEPEPGRFDLADALRTAPLAPDPDGGGGTPKPDRVGDFERAFAEAPVTLDERYTTPDQSHAMMEPHASVAAWQGDRLTIWTSNQMIDWGRGDLARTLGIPKENIRFRSLFLRADALMAALGARAAGRPVKVVLQRPLIFNNTTHRPATVQRIRLGARRDGTITAVAHESGSGDQPGGQPETAVSATRLLYAGANRLTAMRLAVLDLPEGNAMRAPGEAPGLMALEIAMDEMAERLGMDPIDFRARNDTQVDPENPGRPFSQRELVRCFREGATRFGWDRRAAPSKVRDGRWLVGLGTAAAFRNHMNLPSGARVRLTGDGDVVVETDMTDIGTGSYTIIAQTAAEMMGVPMERVVVRLGDSAFPVSCGSGGQFGANSATSGVYAACVKLRDAVAAAFGFDPSDSAFEDGQVRSGNRSRPLGDAARGGDLVAADTIEWGDLGAKYQLSTFGAHFVEVGVDSFTGVVRVRRMLAVCASGRILNPISARSQVIGAMTMGVGGALMEALTVDRTHGFFVNHDLAGYEVPVHLDIPHQDVVFLAEADDKVSPMKAKGIGELGLCGVAAAISNASYNATGVRVRDYPLTLDKHLGGLPVIA